MGPSWLTAMLPFWDVLPLRTLFLGYRLIPKLPVRVGQGNTHELADIRGITVEST